MNNTESHFAPPPKHRVAAKFGRAADAYENNAGVQMEILGRVAGMMRGNVGAGELLCDVGSGGGMLMDKLGELPCGTHIVCLDLALPPLLRACETGRTSLAVNGDIDIIPFKYGMFDGAAAVSMLQWVSSPEGALRNIAKMLKPGGHFYFSVFVDGAFEEIVELRERMGLPPTVWLPTFRSFLMMLEDAGFEASPDDMEFFDKTLWFPDAMAAMGSLSGIGATASGGKLLSRSELDKLRIDYTLLFSKDGNVPLTYRAVIGKAMQNAE